MPRLQRKNNTNRLKRYEEQYNHNNFACVAIAFLAFLNKANEMANNTYKLYPTKNLYISLRLNTTNGKIKLVQWSLEDGKEFSVVLNDKDLSDGISLGKKTERFELYQTKNTFHFLLLDKITGNMWHVQWGFEPENNLIRKIQEIG